MKKRTPEQIVLDGFEGSRQNSPLLKRWSDDTFIGYATAMTVMHNLEEVVTTHEWEVLIRKMLKEGKI